MQSRKISGSMILSSPEAIKLFDSLSQDGLLLEHLSGLFEERAKGIVVSDITEIKETVQRLEKKVDALAKQRVVVAKAETGAGIAPAPSLHIEESAKVETPKTEVKQASIDMGKLSGNGANLLSQMKSMFGGK